MARAMVQVSVYELVLPMVVTLFLVVLFVLMLLLMLASEPALKVVMLALKY